MAQPECMVRSPLPASVVRESSQSVGTVGRGTGSQRNWLGVVSTSLNGVARTRRLSVRRNGGCITDGRMRYVHVRRFRWRAAVKGEPESCSV